MVLEVYFTWLSPSWFYILSWSIWSRACCELVYIHLFFLRWHTEEENAISVSLRRCFFLPFLSESKHCNYSLQLWFFTLLGMEPQEKLMKAIDPTHWKMHIKYQKQFQQYHFSLEAHPRTQVHGQGVRSPCSTKTFFLPAFFILSLVLFSNQV